MSDTGTPRGDACEFRGISSRAFFWTPIYGLLFSFSFPSSSPSSCCVVSPAFFGGILVFSSVSSLMRGSVFATRLLSWVLFVVGLVIRDFSLKIGQGRNSASQLLGFSTFRYIEPS